MRPDPQNTVSPEDWSSEIWLNKSPDVAPAEHP